MTDPNLFSLSFSAFLAVIVVLSVLALVIRFLAFAFRERLVAQAPAAAEGASDPALIAALHAALQWHRPGYRVTRIDETSAREPS
ncbi:MAG: hypothetical protein EA416_06780 [Trueperaceae bacterium]|nr:MAG: hypothetical protein EA416_06780 [Trueperaceae bacterium]